eukprot:scaffold282579_cov20-Prasinocladus_malaysianus.AAC.1
MGGCYACHERHAAADSVVCGVVPHMTTPCRHAYMMPDASFATVVFSRYLPYAITARHAY